MNNYSNYIKYQEVERKFAGAIDMFNSVSFANMEEDISEHWDVKIDLKVDVKAMRKVNRTDDHPNENIHYVEFKNVHGDRGWLYGKADYFAFETQSYYIMVPKIRLQEFVAKKCASKEFSIRQGRKDLITMVKTIDLMYLSDKVIEK
jgi:hypothetical protein